MNPEYTGKVFTVYTGGTFDLFHAGHVNFLRQCAKLGRVVVSLNPDWFIEKYKGKAPIIPYHDRKAVLEACKYVYEVIENSGGDDSKPAIEKAQPDFIVVGSDWAAKDYCSQMKFTKEWLYEHNIVLLYVSYTEGISTTEIKKRILA